MAAKKVTTSEFRLYQPIADALRDLGWDEQAPHVGGQVAWQQEHGTEALGQKRPEFLVTVDPLPESYWVFEAKPSLDQFQSALDEATEYAKQLNDEAAASSKQSNKDNWVPCRLLTAVAGDIDSNNSPLSSTQIETRYLSDEGSWQTVRINGRTATGFLAPDQVAMLLAQNSHELVDYDIDDNVFAEETAKINRILHQGGINKRNRAAVLAALLLTVAQDSTFHLRHGELKVMVRDINARVERFLEEKGQKRIASHLKIDEPTTDEPAANYSKALIDILNVLLRLNIASAINSGRDVLGEFYEEFLRYANDAKELGIVMTPRHITRFAASVLSVEPGHMVIDPACGTGGFLVAALDRARTSANDREQLQNDNLYGVELDPLIAALAITNMIFRGDGSSQILEGDGLAILPFRDSDTEADRCMLNPPFKLKEREWEFVDRGLHLLKPRGLLFAILPRALLNTDQRGAKGWRDRVLASHQLLAVITLPTQLFDPMASVGTSALVLRAHTPHPLDANVMWAVMDDGRRSKTGRRVDGNIDHLEVALQNFIASGSEPDFVPKVLDCQPLRRLEDGWDLSPEQHIGIDKDIYQFDTRFVTQQMQSGSSYIAFARCEPAPLLEGCSLWRLSDFAESVSKGKSGRNKFLPKGDLPLISTSESRNGISAMIDRTAAKVVYPPGMITISANGASCCALYHEYEFAANPDVYVVKLRENFVSREFAILLCAAINSQNWRFDWSRKLSITQLAILPIPMPREFAADAVESFMRNFDLSLA